MVSVKAINWIILKSISQKSGKRFNLFDLDCLQPGLYWKPHSLASPFDKRLRTRVTNGNSWYAVFYAMASEEL